MQILRNKIIFVIIGTLIFSMIGCAPIYLSRKPPEGEVLIRIALQRHQPSIAIFGSYDISVSDKDQRSMIAPGDRWLIRPAGQNLRAETGRGAEINGIEGRLRLWSKDEYFINERRVKGAVDIRSDGEDGLMVIAEMPLEEYLPGVLSLELGGLADKVPEAAKAQAVISRSYAFARIGTNPQSYYDIEAGTSHQCFDLDNLISPAIKRAVADTRGQVLAYGGKVIAPNFHSTCGGRTARPSEIWNARDEDFPYLESVKDDWCSISPKYSWSDTITAEELAGRLYPGKPAVMKDVKVLKVGESGRAISLLVSTSVGDSVLTKAAVRNGLREKPLLSTWFDILIERNAGGDVARIALDGKGYGHGVGLCQWGAIGMARAGKSYKTILKHYYKSVEIARIY